MKHIAHAVATEVAKHLPGYEVNPHKFGNEYYAELLSVGTGPVISLQHPISYNNKYIELAYVLLETQEGGYTIRRPGSYSRRTSFINVKVGSEPKAIAKAIVKKLLPKLQADYAADLKWLAEHEANRQNYGALLCEVGKLLDGSGLTLQANNDGHYIQLPNHNRITLSILSIGAAVGTHNQQTGLALIKALLTIFASEESK